MALSAPLVHSNEILPPKEVVSYEAACYDTETLFTGLKITHKETPIIVGNADDVAGSTMSLWLQATKNNWTIVATKGNLSCVIGSGTGFTLLQSKKRPRM